MILVLDGLLAARCSPGPSAPGSQPTDAGDPDACAAACATLDRLGCEASNPTPEGGSCVAVCLNVETSGYVTLHPACVAVSTSCDAAAACSPGK